MTYIVELNEYCKSKKIRGYCVRNDVAFWYKWTGEEFSKKFLEKLFTKRCCKILLYFSENDSIDSNQYYTRSYLERFSKNLEGILIYEKVTDLCDNIPICKLELLVKKEGSEISWLGKKMLDKLENLLEKDTEIILTDACPYPKYYENLGFKKVKGKRLLERYKTLLGHNSNKVLKKKLN